MSGSGQHTYSEDKKSLNLKAHVQKVAFILNKDAFKMRRRRQNIVFNAPANFEIVGYSLSIF